MRLDDLDLRELLELDPKGGVIRFAGERALLYDAVAFGLLRHELISTFGFTAARGVLTRLGFAHGWRTAENMRSAIPWDSERDWRTAGGRLHALQGLVLVEPVTRAPADGPEPFAEALWRESYEAEQHLCHFGRSEETVCWTLSGFASGYLSYCNGRQIYCIEERCVGRGDPVCHMVGQPIEAWGPAIEPELAHYRTACLEASLAEVTRKLKHTEARLRHRQRTLGAGAASAPGDEGGLIARSPAMRRTVELARRVAPVDSTVLITGESGTGKERLARLIHDASSRAAGPFVAINCAALTDTLLESELFGHARGAFTGASHDRPGLFEAAGGGTLFLDEIGEVPPATQVKLLRVLEEREIRRVGENRARRVDVRVLAATNRDLAAAVAGLGFRKDLYYRLRVVELTVMPLRERRDDIQPLARLFLVESARRMKRKITGFQPRAVEQLLGHDWPGNVRELANAIERAVALATGTRIAPEDLPEEMRGPFAPTLQAGRVRPLALVERDYILGALEASGGNRAETARALGIGIATLHRRLAAYARRRG